MSFFVGEEGLKNLRHYKYRGSDASLVAKYIGQPFWNRCVSLLPLTMAPNLVTVIGFAFMVASYLILIYYSPDLLGETAPRWVFFIIALFQFFYQTLDAIDGKQARRTQTSSPLGELCDHGCDALSSTLCAIQLATAFNCGPGWASVYTIMKGIAPFYYGQWEEYHTGTLDLGVFNVTEAQLIMITIHIMTGILGPQFWEKTIVPVFGGVQLNYFMLGVFTFTVWFSVINNVWKIKVYIAGQKRDLQANPAEQPIHKGEIIQNQDGGLQVTSYRQAAGAGMPYLVLCGFCLAWALFSPTDIVHTHCLWFLGTFGLLFATLVGRMVLSRVCMVTFSGIQTVLFPLQATAIAIVVFGSRLSEYEYMLLLGNYVFSLAAYIFLATDVVQSFTQELDINFLTIKHKKVH